LASNNLFVVGESIPITINLGTTWHSIVESYNE